jgi:N6-L-threonylcarbamoyladenine synthase
VADVITTKTKRAIETYEPKSVIFAGGVSANSYLRERLRAMIERIDSNISFHTPSAGLYGDNAAMIGVTAFYHILRDDVSSWDNIKVDSNWELV